MSKENKKRHNLFYAIIAAPRAGKTTFLFNKFAGKEDVIFFTPHVDDKQKVVDAGFTYVNTNQIKDKEKILEFQNMTLIFDDFTATKLKDRSGDFLYRLAAHRGHQNLDIIFVSHSFSKLSPDMPQFLNLLTFGACGDRKNFEEKCPIWMSQEDIELYKKMPPYEFKTIVGNLLKD